MALVVLLSATSSAQSTDQTKSSSCVGHLGTLDAESPSVSVSGIVAVDAGCTSSRRDPDGTSTFYARRHTFSLAAAATVSVSAGPSSPRSFVILSDGSGAEVGRGQGSSGRYGSSSARLDYLLLAAGTYTAEVTTGSAGQVGSYSLSVSWAPADACVRDLGTLDAESPSVSVSGIVAVDAGCTSSRRDPDGTSTFYARRHTFSLAAAATVSVSAGPSSPRSFVILSDGSGAEVGRGQGSSGRYGSSSARLDYLLLAAGTYTAEVTTGSAGQVGSYSLSVSWAPADACVRDLGTLDAESPSVSVSGIVAVDAGCTSSRRDPDGTSTFYARRHTFSLAAAATVSVSAGPSSPRSFVILSDGSGAEVGRGQGSSGRYGSSSARLDYLLLAAGTYTAEVTTGSAGQVGSYSLSVSWAPADACVRDLGTLDAESPSVSVSGIVAVDAGCTSSRRDPDGTSTFYARRHTFSLAAAATVSVSAGPSSPRSFVILSDGSGAEVGRGQGSSGRYGSSSARLDYLLLAAGTYTAEVTTGSAGQVGSYSLSVSWAPADACVRDLGTLDAESPSVSVSGIVAVDAGCTSSRRDPDGTSTFYARRHTFSLAAAATVSVSAGPSSPRSFVILSDGSGAEVGRGQGSSGRYGSSSARLDYLLLAAGTYTAEVTTGSAGQVGSYSLSVSWAPADACVRDLGTLDAESPSVSVSGIVAVDAGCTSSRRDPDGTSTFYARRHTFSLAAAATVSVSAGPSSPRSFVILSDGSGAEVGRGQGSSGRYGSSSARLDYLLLAAGTYTAEVTTGSAGQVGSYSLSVSWAPADACVRDLGTLDAESPSVSVSGIVAVDAGCTSSRRDPDGTSTFYARRHTFSLAAAATVSVSAGPSSPRSFVILSDGSGAEVGRGQGSSGRYGSSSARLDYLLLAAGTYTAEVTTGSAGQVGSYSLSVSWAPADACVRDLGTLDAESPSVSVSGIVAVDAGCTSSRRDPDGTSTFYARRHTFSLAAAATVSVSAGPSSPRSFVILSDGSGAEVGRGQGSSGRYGSSSGAAGLSAAGGGDLHGGGHDRLGGAGRLLFAERVLGAGL